MKRLAGWRGVLGLTTFACLLGGLTMRATQIHPFSDFSGDGFSDFAIVRNTGGGPTGGITWWISNAQTSAATSAGWGIATDFFVPGDYDGDGKDEVAIWRSGAVGTAGFWVKRSSDGVTVFTPFGVSGDDPTITGDYDGDGKCDYAVYRAGASAGAPSYWWIKQSSNGAVVAVNWGQNGDFVAPGDYDNDGKNDFVIQRNAGGGNANFFIRYATGAVQTIMFGTPTDVIVPGDYDGDHKTDIAIVRGSSGQIIWWVRSSITGLVSQVSWGASATDFVAQGDFDGDGKTDKAVWRPDVNPGASAFYVLRSSGGVTTRAWGQNGDYPVANWNTH